MKPITAPVSLGNVRRSCCGSLRHGAVGWYTRSDADIWFSLELMQVYRAASPVVIGVRYDERLPLTAPEDPHVDRPDYRRRHRPPLSGRHRRAAGHAGENRVLAERQGAPRLFRRML